MLWEYLVEMGTVKGSMKQPKREALDDLALTLWVYRLTAFYDAQDSVRDIHSYFQHLRDTNQRIQAGLSELSAITSALRDWASSALTNPLISHELPRANLAWLENVESVIAQAPLLPFQEPPCPLLHWHDIVDDLAEHFRRAMRSTNPRARLRPSRKGPLARFLVAAIEYVTGETPTPANVAMYLRRKEKKKKGNKPG